MKKPHRLLGIEMRHLAAFDAVVSSGSFARAAQQLGYTQSAVSLQIAALERAAGTRLLERPGGRRPVVPTDRRRAHAAPRRPADRPAAGGRGRPHRARRGHRGDAARRDVPERVDPRAAERRAPPHGAAARASRCASRRRPTRTSCSRSSSAGASTSRSRSCRPRARSSTSSCVRDPLRPADAGGLGARAARERADARRDRPAAADRLQPQHLRHRGAAALARHRAARRLPQRRERRGAADGRRGHRLGADPAARDRREHPRRRRARRLAPRPRAAIGLAWHRDATLPEAARGLRRRGARALRRARTRAL